MRLCIALGVALSIATPAHADDAAPTHADDAAPTHADVETPAVRRPMSAARRAAAIGLAIVPGVAVHGVGAWMVNEKRTGKTILTAEAIGIGVAAVSGLLVGGTGGHPYTIIPGVPLAVAGGGLFLQSWFTDIWVAAGGERIVGQPRATAPWSVELGTSWLHDAYRERALLRGGGRLELGRVDLGAVALVDAAGDAALGIADVRVRLLGEPASGDVIEDGSRVGVRVGTRYHRDDADRTRQWTQEIAIDGRLDLDRIDRHFGPSFVELGAGVGLVHVKYGETTEKEWSSELLARFAWGTYLGTRGDAKLFYEHTRDGLVGGLPAWRAAGFLGSVGAALDLRVYGPWGVRGQLEIGNAWLTTIAIAYRGGPR